MQFSLLLLVFIYFDIGKPNDGRWGLICTCCMYLVQKCLEKLSGDHKQEWDDMSSMK